MADGSPERFVVAIIGPDGTAVGVGTLVGPCEIVTCAHVVNAALGIHQRTQEMPSATVRVEFPLLPKAVKDNRADHSEPEPVVLTTVSRWLPPPRPGAAGDDLAVLVLANRQTPSGAVPAQLAVNIPPAGRRVRVFGYPGAPPRPEGAWVPAVIRGRVGGGHLQLDSAPEAALRVQPGFSGSPIIDQSTGRVAGIITTAAVGRSAERDSYAVTADWLRVVWPDLLRRRRIPKVTRADGQPVRSDGKLTILHLSEPLFRAQDNTDPSHTAPGQNQESLFGSLHDDLTGLAEEQGLHPDLIVVTGDLAARGLPSEFAKVTEFLGALAEAAEVPLRHIAVVPGNHDINRPTCAAYFAQEEGEERQPDPPYWPKWRQFTAAFAEFYADADTVTFTPDEPWTLFEMPDLSVVVAGLNSTIADSHRVGDHYGWVGPDQLHWFAERLMNYRDRGWLRLAALHHSMIRSTSGERECLRDADDLDRVLGRTGLVNLLFHGDTQDRSMRALASGLIALPVGRVTSNAANPEQTPGRYQQITMTQDGFTRYSRMYAAGQRRWVGDTSVSSSGSNWWDHHACQFLDASTALPSRASLEGRPGDQESAIREVIEAEVIGPGAAAAKGAELEDDFLERVARATLAAFPAATIVSRPTASYIRVTNPVPESGTEQWPVGVCEGDVTGPALATFLSRVHSRFAAADPSVRSVFVYGGAPAPGNLVTQARQAGVRLRSFVDYQGLLDLRPLVDRQNEWLENDRAYPADLYVPQRYRLVDSEQDDQVRDGLIEKAIGWLQADSARLIMVLGDFGRGKTSFLRQLARIIPTELRGLLPILVELRGLEKAPSLDELLAQHLVRHGVEDISPAKLRYMVSSGRLALLFDGFDELELRIGYDHAADYLQVLLESVTERAKVVLTSRSQHFRSTEQVRTALGDRVAARSASRMTVLEDFSDDQILRFLTVRYRGDRAAADARFRLLGDVHDLLGLARNPRMLEFIAALDEDRLREVQRERGKISAAELYGEIIDLWLTNEADRHRHRRGVPSLDKQERLRACTALAQRLWRSGSPVIGLADLSSEISNTLAQLAERGYSGEHASHLIGSGSLLVRTEDGMFSFVHQSIMEWLIASVAARSLAQGTPSQVLATRRMTRLMADFFADLAGHDAAYFWASYILADPHASQRAKQNALIVSERVPEPSAGAGGYVMRPSEEIPDPSPPRAQNLAGVDLRGADLRGADLRGADLQGADLRGMRLDTVNLADADLTGADLRGARLTSGSLHGAVLTDSRWDRASLLGTAVPENLEARPELRTAAIADRDTADVMLESPAGTIRSVAFSPDGSLLIIGKGSTAEIIDVNQSYAIRIMPGHHGPVTSVAISTDGTLIATASADGTARIWDAVTGAARTTLTGHDGAVAAVAFAPDGTLIATASADGTARIWDAVTGAARTTLTGHKRSILAVAFAPDGTLIATASADGTARIWDAVTGLARMTVAGHRSAVTAVAFAPGGDRLATALADGTVRIWDAATGTTRITLTGYRNAVKAIAFSPDGASIAVGTNDRIVKISRATRGNVHANLKGHEDAVTAVAYSYDGMLLATASADGTARIWDLTTSVCQARLAGHQGAVTAVAFAPNGRHIVTGSADGTAIIWAPRRGLFQRAVGAAGPWTMSASGIRARTTLIGHDGAVTAVSFAPGGSMVATASADGTARIWDSASGSATAILIGHHRPVLTVAFGPRHDLVATGSSDGTVRIWHAGQGTSLTTLVGHNGAINNIAFSAKGNIVATASADGTARIWDAATGTCMVTLIPLAEGHYAAICADGYKLRGNPGNRLWWTIKLCRFSAGELDPYIPGLRRLPDDAQMLRSNMAADSAPAHFPPPA